MPTTRPRIVPSLGLADAERAGILRGTLALALVGWAPTVLLAAHHAWTTGAWPRVALVFETHARYLVSGPLFLLARRAIDDRIRRCVAELRTGGWISPAETERFAEHAEWLGRLGASTTSAALCLLGAAATVAVNPLVPDADLASRWEASVGLTLYRFVILLAVWHWTVWALFLARLARFDLQLVATHPDRAGGLGFLTPPSEAFSGVVLAVSSIVAARCGTVVFRDGVSFLVFKKEVAFLAVLMTFLGILPLAPFTRRLFWLRLDALREYGAFARDCCARFDTKWLRTRARDERRDPLGTPDIQALADLSVAFDVVATTRPFVVTGRLVATLAVASLVPMVPLLATIIPVEELLPKLLKLL